MMAVVGIHERCINCYRGDEYQNRAHTEKKKPSDIEIGAQSEIDRRTSRRVKHRVENETIKAKIETKRGSEK